MCWVLADSLQHPASCGVIRLEKKDTWSANYTRIHVLFVFGGLFLDLAFTHRLFRA